MPRYISFALTTKQIRDQTKTVTRRKGWKFFKTGTILNACVKFRGLRPGEKIQKICQIRVTGVEQQPLDSMCFPNCEYGRDEARKEGFPELHGDAFVQMFCEHMGGEEDQTITRIEFEYLEGKR